MLKSYLTVFVLLGCLLVNAQNAFWSNNGLVSIKDGAFLSVIGDAYNQNNGIYDNSDSIFVTGNWTHSANNRCFDSIGTGWVYLYADTQHINGTSKTHFYNLILKNRGVKYGDIDVYVDGNLDLTDREFNLDTNTVWVLNPQLTSVKRTSGYVSSLQDGGLLRRTNLTQTYLFPVGSNVGTFRYRPVEFKPLAVTENHFKARFANVDPTTEGYDRNIKLQSVCQVNPQWYHRLYHVTGVDSADITILYDTLADGTWNDIVHWQNLPQWEWIHRDTMLAGVPFFRMSKFTWNNYRFAPFALAITSKLRIDGAITDVACRDSANGAIALTITGAETPYTIFWSTGDTTSTITGLSGGIYTVTVSEQSRCAFLDTFSVFEPTAVVSSIAPTDDTCYGSHNGTAVLTVSGGTPGYTYYWSDTATTQNIGSLYAGNYYLTITDANGCHRLDSVTIHQPPLPNYLVAGVDTLIFRHDTIQLSGFYGNSYQWSPAVNLSCIDCSNPYAWPDSDITYHLSIGDEYGCHYGDSVRIMVRDRPISLFFIPNAITPNGDGYNDTWLIKDLEYYPDNEVRIINRWGDEVFSQKPYQNNWAGTWKGENLPGATYYYILKVNNNGEWVTFDGPLTIIR